MLFGKHLNKYYLKYSPVLLLGLLALVMVDYFQLIVPELYKTVVNGLNDGTVTLADGTVRAFDMAFLLDEVCRPMIFVIIIMVFGRFLWRICFFGTALKVETDLRSRMFDRCKDLSVSFYQVNKVGDLMAKFINDLQTVQDCFGSGILMFFDALLLGVLSEWKMWNMNHMLTFLSLIPMILLFAVGTVVGKNMRRKWETRQEAFSALSDFSQESFSGISVIKAFVREAAELSAFRKLKEAQAEQARALAKGEADAIFAKMEAQARGVQEILSKQAEGFAAIVQAAGGNADSAVQLLLTDKIEELTRIQVEAVKNLNIDKITVWDSMNGENGSSTTANFLSGMMKSIPPLSETFKMAGMKIPEFLGKEADSPETDKTAE